jgi:hypothetical protein
MDNEMEALVASGDVWVSEQPPVEPVRNPAVRTLWEALA